eukprot:SAG31_NODE_8028_length_1537_cov_1.673157_1_plen_295_part_00
MNQNTAEQARQREHQIMTAQIERTHQALDQCCRPIQNDVMAVWQARIVTVQQIVRKLEASHPDAVEKMLPFSTVAQLNPDNTVTSRSSGKMYWAPVTPELTRAVDVQTMLAPSAASYTIANEDAYMVFGKPYCHEMPTAIFDIIAAEPTGEVAELYRAYVCHTMMPAFRRVKNLLQNYAAYVELPPKDWLEKTYPGESWRTYTTSVFVYFWYCYTQSFERVLSEWSDGNVKSVHPGGCQPLGGMIRSFGWSQTRAEQKQSELVGMTAVAELDDAIFSRAVSDATQSFEVETVAR